MEQQLKQRLVGVAVIFSLAVIFLPMLLDGSGQRPESLDITIPPPPDTRSYEIISDRVSELRASAEALPVLQPRVVDELSDPPAPTTLAQAEQAGIEAQPAASKPVAMPVTEPEASPPAIEKEPPGGSSWVIQVGSFSSRDKADKQLEKIRKSGLAAVFTEKFQHDGTLSYRVRMGPFITRDKAKVIQNKLLAKHDIKGLVMRYDK